MPFEQIPYLHIHEFVTSILEDQQKKYIYLNASIIINNHQGKNIINKEIKTKQKQIFVFKILCVSN